MDDDEHNAQGGGHNNSSMALSKPHRGDLQARVAYNSHTFAATSASASYESPSSHGRTRI